MSNDVHNKKIKENRQKRIKGVQKKKRKDKETSDDEHDRLYYNKYQRDRKYVVRGERINIWNQGHEIFFQKQRNDMFKN